MARLMIDDDHGVAFEDPQDSQHRGATMRDMVERREREKEASRRHIAERLRTEGLTRRSLLNAAYAANYNNIILYDTLMVYAQDVLDGWRTMRSGGESMVPRLDEPRHRRMTDAMVRMERCCNTFRQFEREQFKYKGNMQLLNEVSNLYYEAVFRDVQLLEINVKQQLDKMGFAYSRLIARLESMRMIACLGIGLSWSIEDLTFVGYGDGRTSYVDKRANMTAIQHWICALQTLFDVPVVKADPNVEASFNQFCGRVETGSLAIECFVIIGDEHGWRDLPKWFIIDNPPSDDLRKDFKYKTREDIEK